jgi:hypothetical protein
VRDAFRLHIATIIRRERGQGRGIIDGFNHYVLCLQAIRRALIVLDPTSLAPIVRLFANGLEMLRINRKSAVLALGGNARSTVPPAALHGGHRPR